MNWHWCDRKGKECETDVGFQMDKVGNILQRTGAVRTKACQNCGTEFATKKNQDEVKQHMDKYKCNDCEFESNNPQESIIHTIRKKEHTLEVEEDTRIVGFRNTLKDTAVVEFKDKDCIILCQKCNDVD